MADKTFAFPCGCCDGGSTSESGLRYHATTYHRGVPRTEWQRGWEPKRRERLANGHTIVTDESTGEQVPVVVAMSRKHYGNILAEINRPRGAAEDFVGLPWPKMPSTPEACDEIARILGVAASDLDAKSESYAIVMSQRDYYLALGARKLKQKIAA